MTDTRVKECTRVLCKKKKEKKNDTNAYLLRIMNHLNYNAVRVGFLKKISERYYHQIIDSPNVDIKIMVKA